MEIRARKRKSELLGHPIRIRRKVRDTGRVDKRTRVLETERRRMTRKYILGNSKRRHENEEARSIER